MGIHCTSIMDKLRHVVQTHTHVYCSYRCVCLHQLWKVTSNIYLSISILCYFILKVQTDVRITTLSTMGIACTWLADTVRRWIMSHRTAAKVEPGSTYLLDDPCVTLVAAHAVAHMLSLLSCFLSLFSNLNIMIHCVKGITSAWHINNT